LGFYFSNFNVFGPFSTSRDRSVLIPYSENVGPKPTKISKSIWEKTLHNVMQWQWRGDDDPIDIDIDIDNITSWS